MLHPDNVREHAHRSPDFERRSIHVEKTCVVAVVSAPAVDADDRNLAEPIPIRQKFRHADRRGILKVLHVHRALGDDGVVHEVACGGGRLLRRRIQPMCGWNFVSRGLYGAALSCDCAFEMPGKDWLAIASLERGSLQVHPRHRVVVRPLHCGAP